jgi:tetratricopeptide (TPR) repeat protein
MATTTKQCKRCGSALSEGACPNCADRSFRVAHRDLLLLSVLCITAIGGFIFTRYVAAADKQVEDRVGEIWFQTGEQQLAARQYDRSIESFRKARARDRDKREYVLALATALESANHTDEARQALLHIRETAPENAEVNLSLARLDAKRQDVTESLRYYHNALYGLWTGSQVDEQRRKVRIELIDFLLAHQQPNMALSELLVLDTELPDTVRDYDIVGKLFLRARDPAHALKDFDRALHLDRHDATALEGAGQAAFDTQDYSLARKDLEAASGLEPHNTDVQHLLALVLLVFSRDPLLPRLGREERLRRATDDYDQAINTLHACLDQQATKAASQPVLISLDAEAQQFQDQLKSKDAKQDPEVVRDSIDLVYRIEHAVNANCTPVQGSDKALLLIGRRHLGALQ